MKLEFRIMLFCALYFVWDFATATTTGQAWVLLDSGWRFIIASFVLIDHGRPLDSSSDDYRFHCWKLQRHGSSWYADRVQITSYGTRGQLLTSLTLVVLLATAQTQTQTTWLVALWLVVVCGGWVTVVAVNHNQTTFNRYSRLVVCVATVALTGLFMLQWLMNEPLTRTGALKLAWVQIGSLVFLVLTCPRLPGICHPIYSINLWLATFVLAGFIVWVSCQDTDYGWSPFKAWIPWVWWINTLVVMLAGLYWAQNELAMWPPLGVQPGTIRNYCLFQWKVLTRGIDLALSNRIEWVGWIALFGWIMVWDWLLPALPHVDGWWSNDNMWQFSHSPRHPPEERSVSYDAIFLLLFNSSFIQGVVSQWPNYHRAVLDDIHSVKDLVRRSEPLQYLNYLNSVLVGTGSLFNFALNIMSLLVYLSQIAEPGRWWITRSYEDRTQLNVEMFILDVVLMSSLWPNILELGRQHPSYSTRPATRWWYLFYGWNYALMTFYTISFLWIPHSYTQRMLWFVVLAVLAVSWVVILLSLRGCLSCICPRPSAPLFGLYVLAMLLTFGSLGFPRTLLNYLVTHGLHLGVIVSALVVLVQPQTSLLLLIPRHNRVTHWRYDHFVLQYDILYATLYLLYIATLNRLIDRDQDAFAAIWRNFAVNVASYLYIFTKYFTMPFHPLECELGELGN